MNWNQMATNATFVLTLIGATWGGVRTLSSLPHTINTSKSRRYDERLIYREYREVINIKHKSDIDKQRLADLEHAMILKRDAIRAARKQ